MSRIRIIVADQAEAIFYDTASLRTRPKEVARISDPLAHQHNRDFSSDRPGRSYESFGSARHAIARENEPRRREAPKRPAREPHIQMPAMPPTSRIAPKYSDAWSSVMP